MLEFVHFTGADSGKDVQTRRKVRSQAMRDFRRRQREEREPTRKQIPRSNSSTSASQPERVRSYSDGLVNTRLTAARPSPAHAVSLQGPGLDKLIVVDFASSRPSPGVSVSHDPSSHNGRPMGPVRVQSEASIPTRRRSSRPQRTRRQSTSPTKSSKQVQKCAGEQPWSPVQIRQMIEYCNSYMKWLQPDIDSDATAAAFATAWEDTKSPMLLAAFSLASIGHIGAVDTSTSDDHCAVYKDRVLREVAKRMQSPETAVRDETIGGLACLLSFEVMSKGSDESLTHLKGLKSIVDLKGGIDSPDLDSPLAMMIESLDLIHAVMFGTSPMIAMIEPATEYGSVSGISAFERLSRIITAEHEDFRRYAHPAYRTRLEPFPRLLANAVDAFDLAWPAEIQSNEMSETDSVLRFRATLEEARTLSMGRESTVVDAHYLARICYLEMLVWYNLISHKISPGDANNAVIIDGLYDTMRKIDDLTWQQVPYMRLWVLLTGLCGTNSTDQKSYFKAELVRSIYQLGMTEWRRAKTFMLRFIEIAFSLNRETPLTTSYQANTLPMNDIDIPDYPSWTSAPANDNLAVPIGTPLSYASGSATCSSSETIFDMPQTSRMPSPLPPLSSSGYVGSIATILPFEQAEAYGDQDQSWLEYTDDSLNVLNDPAYWLVE